MLARAIGASLLLAGGLAACAGPQDRSSPAPATSAAVPSGSPTNCFEPLPGHPTAAEKSAFVRDVSRLATEAEQRHGVPAAAIAAMAIQESGYGWTALAQNTNNVLAWKHTSSEAAGGRPSWVLQCPGQAGARYIVFASRADAVDFVAEQLATSNSYGADTERYRRDRATGGDVVAAVDRWVDAVADPYSTQPEAYRTAIKRIMNDPLDPSDIRSPAASLYRLSEAARPPARSTQATPAG